ncbi:MAG: tetratricopeptide repeat protein, partial [Zoogloeaceae bacterium]|nr:tetratricopeptide repeat protein [Zoogloeaceae bacterium]
MSNSAFLRRALAQAKLFFLQNKGPIYKATVGIALVLAVLVGVIEIFGNGDNAENKTIECNGVIEQGVCYNDGGTVHFHIQGQQPILPNLEYLADEDARMAKDYYERLNYPKALEHYKKAYETQTQAWQTAQSKESRDVRNKARADILVSKGVMHARMAQYPEADDDFTRAEKIYETLPAGERDYAVIYHNRGFVFDEQGDYNEALEWYRKALDIKEKVLGKDHPDTATTYNNIALVYKAQGEYGKALEEYRKALDILEKVLGKDHPYTATTYNNIGLVYDAQGEYGKALEEYRKALDIQEKVPGKDHPSTATTYNNIAA